MWIKNRFVSFNANKNWKHVSCFNWTWDLWIWNMLTEHATTLMHLSEWKFTKNWFNLFTFKRHLNKNVKPTIKNMYLEYEWKCCYCWKTTILFKSDCNDIKDLATIEHIIPRSKWWSNEWSNLALCCQWCNNTKWDQFIEKTQLQLNVAVKVKPTHNWILWWISKELAMKLNLVLT